VQKKKGEGFIGHVHSVPEIGPNQNGRTINNIKLIAAQTDLMFRLEDIQLYDNDLLLEQIEWERHSFVVDGNKLQIHIK